MASELGFLVALLANGALAGAIYALVALAFVVVYKASRMINFALGDLVMLAARLAAAGWHVGLGLLGALAFSAGSMVALAVAFNRLVLRRLVGQPLISMIMVTIGLGLFLSASATILFRGLPATLPLPIAPEALAVGGVRIPPDKAIAAAIALASIGAVSWFFRRSRTGLALRAVADDQQVAMAMGIGLHRHLTITWALAGGLCVIAGALWTFIAGSGFGLELVGLKVFPIVIIGGLDSIPGTLLGAMLVGVVESVAAGYLDPVLGGGFSGIASYLVLLAVLLVRPHGLLGKPGVERV